MFFSLHFDIDRFSWGCHSAGYNLWRDFRWYDGNRTILRFYDFHIKDICFPPFVCVGRVASMHPLVTCEIVNICLLYGNHRCQKEARQNYNAKHAASQSRRLRGDVKTEERSLLATAHKERPKVRKWLFIFTLPKIHLTPLWTLSTSSIYYKENVPWFFDFFFSSFCILLIYMYFIALTVEGELLWLTKITRSEMGIYLCIASNQVPPSVSKRIKLQIHCKWK